MSSYNGAANLRSFKSVGTSEKMGKRVWSIKMPLEYEEKLSKMDKERRIVLFRQAIKNMVDRECK